jgi:hypothetical protein
LPSIRGLTPTAYIGEGSVPFGTEGLHLPPRYAVEVDDPECPVLVEIHVEVIDGQPRCAELRCRPRPGGPPVTSEDLRKVPLARYLRQSAWSYTKRVQLDEDGEVLFVQATGAGDEPAHARAARRPRQEMTNDLLREVARIYTEAETKPTLAVMRRKQVSRATASRWVKAARKNDFIIDTDDKEQGQ